MYQIIKNVILSKDYELRDILYKINKMYIESTITEEEKTELDELARTNAIAKNSYASLEEQVENIYSEIDSIKSRLATLENTEEPEEPIEPVDEYPLYKQPSGAHDAYKVGDKITYNGKKYVCKLDGCVWTPDDYPAGWEEVVEETADTVESEEDNATN